MDQLGLPRKDVLTPGNIYDSPFLPELIHGLKPKDICSKRCAANVGPGSRDWQKTTIVYCALLAMNALVIQVLNKLTRLNYCGMSDLRC